MLSGVCYMELADVAAVQVGDALVQRAGLVRPSKQKSGGSYEGSLQFETSNIGDARSNRVETRSIKRKHSGRKRSGTQRGGKTRHRALRPEVA
ncbi:hypothetical protein N7516_003568 [Penicillium verrucosum]|uniref:uncharacterized protein n=1 Tax=Penicillium verrucosum TaxID=60171 RepID=UPI00254555A2|nr:uncharacterized protein N7516_003568 [Penicillium verrucosum]KAJ5943400.1 hypothetical protein N7516_003568 [Penicillium verrucosum]